MKKVLFMIFAAVTLTACESGYYGGEVSRDEPSQVETKKFTFTVKGDFKSPTFNKSKMRKAASALADDAQLTDLWVFDYQDGAIVQTLHQSAGDADWGKPVLNLTYGHHDVCFVASRGTTPAVSGDVITWAKPSDTFWLNYAIDVVGTSNGNRSVTLDRVATRLRITPTDEVPSNVAKVTITPAVWYYGLNILTGEPSEQRNTPREIAVPASYLGTTGELTLSIFGLSAADEWTTSIEITATDASGVTIGKASITAAPFKRNRSTDYSGPLFGTSGETSVMLNNEWSEPYVGEW